MRRTRGLAAISITLDLQHVATLSAVGEASGLNRSETLRAILDMVAGLERCYLCGVSGPAVCELCKKESVALTDNLLT